MKKLIFIKTGILGCILAILASCAPTTVSPVSEYGGSLPSPDQVLVYNFAVSPDEIKLDQGLGAKIEALSRGTSRTDEERAVGVAVADALAENLVKELQSMGIPAQRAAGMMPIGGNIVEVTGQFISIDEGNRTERVVIGFGAGRSDVKTYVQIFDGRGGQRMPVYQFESDAKSGYKPGMAETMGVGAAAGHLGASAAVGGALAVGSEAFKANVEADAKRDAKAIAKQIGDFFAQQGWIPQESVQ